MAKTISPRSPKNKYYAELVYFPAYSPNSSVDSFGAMELSTVKSMAAEQIALRYNSGYHGEVHVVIKENKATYPSFQWEIAEQWQEKVGRGGARPGAGRKPRENKRQIVSCRVAPETKAKLVEISRETGEGIGAVIDFIVEDYCKIAR